MAGNASHGGDARLSLSAGWRRTAVRLYVLPSLPAGWRRTTVRLYVLPSLPAGWRRTTVRLYKLPAVTALLSPPPGWASQSPIAPNHLGYRAQFWHQVHEILVIERLAAIRFGPIGVGMHFDDHAIGPRRDGGQR